MWDKLSRISWKFRLIFEVVIIAVICAVIYYFSYSPKVDEIVKLQKKVDSLSLKVSQLKPVKASYAKFKKEFELLEKQFQTVLQILPNEKNYNVLYDEIVGLAERSGVKITVFQPTGERKVDSFHSSVNFKMNMETNYQELINYLYRLNYVNKIINLNSMNIDAKANKEGILMLNISSGLNSFRFNVPQVQQGAK